MRYMCSNNLSCIVSLIREKLLVRFESKWFNDMLKPKLQNDIQIKHNYGVEQYVTADLSRSQRSLIAQLRTGILPLALEVGRFKNIQEDNRLSELRELGETSHFLLYCPFDDEICSAPRNVLGHRR